MLKFGCGKDVANAAAQEIGCAPMLTRCWRMSAMTMRNTDSSSRRTLLKRDCVAKRVRCVKERWRNKCVRRRLYAHKVRNR